MPHVALVASSGIRVRERAMLELGMSLPSLVTRTAAISALPSLGLLTLGALVPSHWDVSWHEFDGSGPDGGNREPSAAVGTDLASVVDRIVRIRPTLVASEPAACARRSERVALLAFPCPPWTQF